MVLRARVRNRRLGAPDRQRLGREIFSTEEALTGFPYAPDEPYPGERTFRLAVEILDEDSSGAWWDAKRLYPTEEEREPWS
jgi:hypothetical protein